jgi:hypothetical protein
VIDVNPGRLHNRTRLRRHHAAAEFRLHSERVVVVGLYGNFGQTN